MKRSYVQQGEAKPAEKRPCTAPLDIKKRTNYSEAEAEPSPMAHVFL
jgi:hypothetical protein